jgi:uncharacterized protein
MFLFVLYFGRRKIYSQLQEQKPLLRKVQRWALGIGIPAGIAYACFHSEGKSLPVLSGVWDTITFELNIATLSIGYAATIALWYINASQSKILQRLQPLRRMALTHYLAQNIFGISIYYGIGAGLGANIGPIASYL